MLIIHTSGQVHDKKTVELFPGDWGAEKIKYTVWNWHEDSCWGGRYKEKVLKNFILISVKHTKNKATQDDEDNSINSNFLPQTNKKRKKNPEQMRFAEDV